MMNAFPRCSQLFPQQTISDQGKDEDTHLREEPAKLPVKEEQCKSDDKYAIKKREHAVGKKYELQPPVVLRYLNRCAKDVLADEETNILGRVVAKSRNFEVIDQREISVQPDQRIHVNDDRGKPCRNHESEREIVGEVSRRRKIPDKSRDRANNQLDKRPRERDPKFGRFALERPRVSYVCIECRHKVDQHKADLMNFTAIAFAR